MELLQHTSPTDLLHVAEDNRHDAPLRYDMLQEIEEQLLKLIAKGGPEVADYDSLADLMNVLHHDLKAGNLVPHEVDKLKQLFDTEFLTDTIHGHVYRKPMGYAGDFLLIDKIYTYHKTTNRLHKKWDDYFHTLTATQAVRNRKSYFKTAMVSKLNEKHELNLLNVASGPARDLAEFYQKIDTTKVRTTCVDIDARAITYAEELCNEYISQITFINKNILRFTPAEKFDVIWSAGLFDYFEDKVFVVALKKFLSWLKPGGEIIVGNFSEDNSSRGYMEVFGEWILLHRSPEDLIRLSMLAGAKRDQILVDQEPLGVNLFLRIKA